jgi:hypothetical protein
MKLTQIQTMRMKTWRVNAVARAIDATSPATLKTFTMQWAVRPTIDIIKQTFGSVWSIVTITSIQEAT